MDTKSNTHGRAAPWNKGKLLGQKPSLKFKARICRILEGISLAYRTSRLSLRLNVWN